MMLLIVLCDPVCAALFRVTFRTWVRFVIERRVSFIDHFEFSRQAISNGY